MVKMVNRVTGSVMWVTEERKDEYLAAGHKLAAEPAPAKEPKKRTKKEDK